MFELGRQWVAENYTTFAYGFVLSVGPEGVIVWQAWGRDEYGMEEWIAEGGSRLRDWQEADVFVDTFEKFGAYKVSLSCAQLPNSARLECFSYIQGQWDAKRNRIYKKCLHVDIHQVCGAKGSLNSIAPKVQS